MWAKCTGFNVNAGGKYKDHCHLKVSNKRKFYNSPSSSFCRATGS